MTVGKLLIELWKKEEANMRVTRDENGAILGEAWMCFCIKYSLRDPLNKK